MRVLRSASASRTTVASVAALYVLVVALTVVLISSVLSDPLNLDFGLAWVLLGIGILLPLGLLAVIVVSVLRLLRERRLGRPGSGLKIRLTAFFGLVVFLATVPQGIVSVSFLATGLNVVLRSETGTAVRQGLDAALDFADRQVYYLRQVALDGTLAGLISDAPPAEGPAGEDPPPVWPELRARLPEVATVQVVDSSGQELLLRGDPQFAASTTPSGGGGDLAVTRVSLQGEDVIQLSTPVADTGFAVVTTRLPASLSGTPRLLTDAAALFNLFETIGPRLYGVLTLLYGFFTAPILLLSIMAGFFLSDRIMQPIESLEDATRRVAEGDYSVRILARPGDDLGILVGSFNRMVTELDRARRRMAQAEKVQAWQEIAQRLAHEVKNPLTPIKLAAQRVERRFQNGAPDFPETLTRTVATIVREVDALSELLNEFRSFSRMPEPQFAPVDLALLLRECAEVFRTSPGVRISSDEVPAAMQIMGDRGQLRQVFTNLFTNAVEAASGSVTVSVSAREIRQGSSRVCRLRVEDNGPGVPEELRSSLFEPYVTSKKHGTGLGLAIVERIVFDHEGRISCESAPGRGTSFVIDLPVEQAV